jgi:hypothetical protein
MAKSKTIALQEATEGGMQLLDSCTTPSPRRKPPGLTPLPAVWNQRRCTDILRISNLELFYYDNLTPRTSCILWRYLETGCTPFEWAAEEHMGVRDEGESEGDDIRRCEDETRGDRRGRRGWELRGGAWRRCRSLVLASGRGVCKGLALRCEGSAR